MFMGRLSEDQKIVVKETAAIFISHYMETDFWKNMSSEKKEEFVLSEILDCMSYLINSSEGLNRMLEILDILNKNDTKEEDNIVEVVRYLRPFGSYGNLYGVTAVFDIDYDKEIVKARFSVCNGDNFDKKKGVEIAKKSKKVVTFSLGKVDEHSGLMNALMNEICNSLLMRALPQGTLRGPVDWQLTSGNYMDKHELFLEALDYKV